MQKVLTTKEMQNADKYTINVLGTSEKELISRAGDALSSFIFSKFKGGKVLFLIGKGNNGKDGERAFLNLSNLQGFNAVKFYAESSNLAVLNGEFDILVDCLFGVGLNREISGKYYSIIEKANAINCVKIACDIPSGINADSGEVLGIAFKADYTICIQEYKLGHFLNDGIDYSGKLIKKDVQISTLEDNYTSIIEKEDFKTLFPPRKRNLNKGQNGSVAVFGGSKQYFGSALLSANSLCSLKLGAGYGYLYIPESLFSVYAGKNPEVILKTIKDKNGALVYDESALLSLLNCNSVAFGMGAGTSENLYKTIEFLLKNYKNTLVLDADALNSLAKFGMEILKEKSCKVVLTPHLKEFSRLSGISLAEIKKNSVEIAKEFSKKYNVILVLKSAVTIITDGENTYLNASGTSGMAKAGSGDVLSGIISGILRNKGDELFKTACACYLFGRAGELAVKEQNEYTITATDIINCIPKVINE